MRRDRDEQKRENSSSSDRQIWLAQKQATLILKSPANPAERQLFIQLKEYYLFGSFMLNNGRWASSGLAEIIHKFDSLRVSTFLIDRNQQPQILKQISGVRFCNMTLLCLSSNQICSIQPLAWLDAPVLQSIYTYQLRYQSGRALRKAILPALQQLCLDDGYQELCWVLPACNFNLEIIDIYPLNKSELLSTLSYLVKLKSSSLKSASICASIAALNFNMLTKSDTCLFRALHYKNPNNLTIITR